MTAITTSITLDDSGYHAAAQRVVGDNVKIAETQRQIIPATTGAAASFDRLKRSLDPVYDAEKKIEKATRDADAAIRAGKASIDDKAVVLARLTAKLHPATESMRGLGVVSDELRVRMAGLGGQAGMVGTALQAMGPSGLAAAAGIGAMVLGFNALMTHTRQAIDRLDDLGDKAAKIGISAEGLQEMRFAFDQMGVPIETVDDALAAFNVTVGKVGLQGDETAEKIRVGFAALRIPLDDVAKADPTQLLQRVATEIRKVDDTARQAAIAKALGIEALLPALREGGDAIANLRNEARKLGLVLDEDLVKNAGAAKNQLTAMQGVLDAQLTQALVNATPLVLGLASGFAKVAEFAGLAVDRLKEVDRRASHTLKAEIGDLDRQIKMQEQNVATAQAPRNLLERSLASVGLNRPQELEVQQGQDFLGRLRAERDRRQAILGERERLLKDMPQSRGGGGRGTIDLGGGSGGGGASAVDRAAEQARRLAEADARIIDDLAKQILLFGDARRQFVDQAISRLSEGATAAQRGQVEQLANQMYDLKEAQTQAADAAREHQAALADGARIYEATRTPAEQYAATLQHLSDLQTQGALDADTYSRAIDLARKTAARDTRAAVAREDDALGSARADAARRAGNVVEALEIEHQQRLRQIRDSDFSLETRDKLTQAETDKSTRLISDAEQTRFSDWLKAQPADVQKVADALGEMGSSAADAFATAAINGGKLSDVMLGLASDLQKVLVKMAMMKLIEVGANALVGAFSGGASAGQGYGTANVGGNFAQAGGGSYASLPYAQGGVFDMGNVIPFARGGVVDRPTIFPMARGAAGLMGEAGPEAVLPLKRLPSGNLGVESGGGSKVTVNVINNAGAKVTTEEKKDEDGGMKIDVMIDAVEQAMAARASRPGSTLNRALAQAANPVRAR